MDNPRRGYEFRLLDQADKIRIVLVAFFAATLHVSPTSTVSNPNLALLVIGFAALYAIFSHFVLDWSPIRREGHMHLMAAFLLCADVLYISTFIWAMGPAFMGLAILLLLEVVFAAAFFTGFELPLVTGIVCFAHVLFAIRLPHATATSHGLAGVGATLVVAWLAYTLAEVGRREQATTARIVRYLTEGVVLITSRGELAVVNPRIEHMLGVVASGLVGLSIHDPANAQVLAPLADVLVDVAEPEIAAPTITTRQLEIENPNPLDIQVVTIPCVAEGGQVVAWVVVCKDITDVLSTVRVKEEGLAVISHELRGRLHSVRASSELLMRMADRLSPEVRAETMKLLDVETRQLSRLIGRTLEATGVEDGSAVFEFESMPLAEVARQACAAQRGAADEKQVSLELDIPDNLPEIRGDATRLDQVIRNLLENAIKFTPPGGEVSVGLAAVDAGVCASVTDTGCGVPADRRDMIFDKFVHGESGGAAYVDGGLGLGLYIVREIVNRHDGTVRVQSVQGAGSVFSVTIPYADGKQTQTPEPADALAAP